MVRSLNIPPRAAREVKPAGCIDRPPSREWRGDCCNLLGGLVPQKYSLPPIFIHADPIRRPWAMRLAVALVLLGAALNLNFLWNNCPLGLSDDEAHYYLWSQPGHLDTGYYSKPPAIAWVMRAAETAGQFCGIPHATMPVLRTAAVAFSILTGLLSIALARRIFRDDRVALMVTVLSAAVPMFVVGALLITIDSPMFVCWAATLYCLWRAIEGAEVPTRAAPACWLYAAGAAMGVGMLFKPVLIAIPLCELLAAWRNADIRRRLFRWHALGALVLMLAMQTPYLIWNAQHHWVMFLHIRGQAGMQNAAPAPGSGFNLLRPLNFLGTQAGGMGGVLFVLLVCAVIAGVRHMRRGRASSRVETALPSDDARRAAMAFSFLVCFTVPLFAFYFLLALFTNVEPNWPAASYFTGMLLLAGVAGGFWADRTHRDHRAWKGWVIAAVVWGLTAATIVQNMQWFYPLAQSHLAPLAGTQPGYEPPAYEKSWWQPRHWDVSLRLREPLPRAQVVQQEVDAMTATTGQPLVVAGRYNIASSLSFYLHGRPFVFCIGPWLGNRQSQYDIWPGLDEKDAAGRFVYAGRDVLYVGDLDAAGEALLRGAFERVDAPQMKAEMFMGIDLRPIRVQRCYGFRGLPATPAGGIY